MCNESKDISQAKKDQAYHRRNDDGTDLICSAIDYLRGILHKNGDAYWQANTFRQKAHLEEWATNLGLLIDAEDILPRLVRGGQEHDLYEDQEKQRIIKVTRNDFFGLSPGIELALVSSSKDARRLHLWEASPYQYLERLLLHNKLVPYINRLEGLIVQGEEIAIVTSQPKLDINPVTESEIDEYFRSLRFEKIASASYYRAEDNLGVFDAHDKNVLRSTKDPALLIPFDVIPCQPQEGFLLFIQSCLTSGHSVTLDKKSHTSDRIT